MCLYCRLMAYLVEKKSEENGNQDALSLQAGIDKMMQMFSRIHGRRS